MHPAVYGRQELILNPDISITLDYDQLIQEECTDVYHGEFLTSFYIKGAPAFEEWMLAKALCPAYLSEADLPPAFPFFRTATSKNRNGCSGCIWKKTLWTRISTG